MNAEAKHAGARQVARPLIFGTVLCACLSTLHASDAPEYIEVESPIPESLEEVRSTTDHIGVTRESWIEDTEPFPLHPSRVMPILRERYVPETGEPFLDEVLFSVRPRFYYLYQDRENEGVREAAALGGSVGMETGWWRDTLRVTMAGYTSQKLYGPEDRDGTRLLREGQKGYTVLGQALLELQRGDSSLFLGRTRIDLPYLNARDFRMTPNTFGGVGFQTLAIPKLQLTGRHVRKIKVWDSSTFVPMSEQAGTGEADRGVSVVGMRYNFTDDFYLGCVEQYGWDMFNTLYFESDWLFELTDDVNVRIGAQFTDQRSVGDEFVGSFSTQSAGGKAAFGYKSLIVTGAFTWTADSAGITNPWGGTPSFNSIILADFDRAGEKSAGLKASLDLAGLGLEGFAASVSWVHGDTPDSGRAASPDEQELDFTVDYRPAVEVLENFWLRLRYASLQRDAALGGNDIEDFRVILNYSYSF